MSINQAEYESVAIGNCHLDHRSRCTLHSIGRYVSYSNRHVHHVCGNHRRHRAITGAILLVRVQRAPARANVSGVHHGQVLEISTRDVGDANEQRYQYEDSNDCKLDSSLSSPGDLQLTEPRLIARHDSKPIP